MLRHSCPEALAVDTTSELMRLQAKLQSARRVHAHFLSFDTKRRLQRPVNGGTVRQLRVTPKRESMPLGRGTWVWAVLDQPQDPIAVIGTRNGVGEMLDNSMLAAFAGELDAHRYLEAILWPNGPVCPCCGIDGRVGRLDGASTRIGAHKCYSCRKIFSITYGTILERSHVPLHKWLQAIYLTDGGVNPIRPHHLSRILAVSFNTAKNMLLKLKSTDAKLDSATARTPPKRLLSRVQASAQAFILAAAVRIMSFPEELAPFSSSFA